MRGFTTAVSSILIILVLLSIPIKAVEEKFEYTIDLQKSYQEMEGFGGSMAWYENYLTTHPHKEELYDVIFKDLGLDILRFQNWYGKRSPLGQYEEEIVKEAEKSLGYPIKILITSWTPHESLKSNNNLENGGTLIKENGQYAYDKFADYWYESLLEYEEHGIKADYISIQNEPDYEADWNSCLFAPVETDEKAGYNKALAAVYEKLKQELDNPPMLVGPETIGIGYMEFYDYLEEMNLNHIYAIAHHLYRGGDHTNPNSFNYSLRQLNERYPDILKFQTEFERGEDGFRTAWLIHNSLVEGNINAYLYWDLIWNNGGLVFLENPYFKFQWRTEKGYYKTDEYYALQHYSKFIGKGYKRVGISGGEKKIKFSAFISPDENELIIVGANTLLVEQDIKLNIPDFKFSSSEVYKSVFPREEKRFYHEGPLSEDNIVSIPEYSVVTVRIQK